MKQIPLKKGRKEPRDNDWRRNVYSSEAIEKWKQDGGNVGLRLDAGDVVIDVDPKHDDAKGRSSRDLLDLLELEFGLDFSEDLIVETGGKIPGYHVHLTKPEDIRIREKLKDVFGGSIEFKSVGRQVLAPGCIHPDGGTYRVIQGGKRRPCPEDLLTAITRPKAEARSGDGGTVTHGQLAEALAQLDPAEFSDYDAWRDMLFACHHGSNGSPEGLEAFKAWSVGDPNHADAGDDIEYFWEAADSEFREGRTIDSLYYQLSTRGLGFPPGDPKEEFAGIMAELRAEENPPYNPEWRFGPKPKKGGNRLIRADLVHNIRQAMRLLKFEFYRDEFTGDIRRVGTKELFTDDDIVYLGAAISDTMGNRWTGDCSKDKRFEAVVKEAHENVIHPVRDYFASLKWDGTKRMERWLIDHADAEDNEYVRGVSKLFLVAAVARIYRPGCKFDSMVILEGIQGTGKSTLVRRLGKEWALEGLPPLRSAVDKDVVDAMRGKWIIEIEEMNVAKKADSDAMKAFITRCVDRVRLPYERSSRDFPRQCIFVGTVNDDSYLQDSTGNRRYLPIKVGRIKLEDMNVDQLWAEAVESWNANPDFEERLKLAERLWGPAGVEQERRRIADPWEGQAHEYVHKFAPKEFVTSESILIEAFGVMPQNQTTRTMKRLANVMQRLGIERGRQRLNGVTRRGYIVPQSEEDLLS
jgi:hypothetical protein